jgi:hypothetical protein
MEADTMAIQKGQCERCGKRPVPVGEMDLGLLDYCAVCSKDLCDECMAEGCCGNVPALSGTEENDKPMSEEEWQKIRERHERLKGGK